jgi:hypothetical protein
LVEGVAGSLFAGSKITLSADFDLLFRPIAGYFKYNCPFGVTLNLGYFRTIDIIKDIKILLKKKMTLADMENKLTEMKDSLANMQNRVVELRDGAAGIDKKGVKIINDTTMLDLEPHSENILDEAEDGADVIEVEERTEMIELDKI